MIYMEFSAYHIIGNLSYVVFIIQLESKRSPGTDFAVEDMNGYIRAILVYFRISNQILSHPSELLAKTTFIMSRNWQKKNNAAQSPG